VLSDAQKQFRLFGDLMGSMEKQVGTVQNTIQKLGVRTRAINKTLEDVGAHTTETTLDTGSRTGAFDGLLPMLAAAEDE
jgi:DNA recombination protein RmuC